jgi:aryl-alcohol dehydrogenase-like predicted oxidoreductase
LEQLALQKQCKPSQLALAWVLAQGQDIVAIPGTKRLKFLEENIAAEMISFTVEELQTLNDIAPLGVAHGTRYHEYGMTLVGK